MFHDEVKGGRLGWAQRCGRLAGGGHASAAGWHIRWVHVEPRVWWLGSGAYLPCFSLLYMPLDVQPVPYMWAMFIMWPAAAVK
eukprot:scaffold14218_cov87-Skeletonema_marinoi.AAC.1